MNQNTVESGNRLSEVLSRIHALSRQEPSTVTEDDIPRLVETYDGDHPLHFVEAGSGVLPTLNHALHDEADAVTANVHPIPPETEPVSDRPVVDAAAGELSAVQREQLLQEMEPVIRDAVKRAILKELVVIEKALKTTLEQDLIEELKQRLDSGRF